MPLPNITQTITHTRLENVATCLTMTTNTLQIIADSMKTPFLGAIINTTNAVLKNIQTVDKHKEDCVQLLEQIHKLLDAIMIIHIKANAGGELPIRMLDHVGKFTEYFTGPFITYCTLTKGIRILHKSHTFLVAQQKGNRVKSFFCQGELGTLLKNCQAGLQQSFEFFQVCCQFHVATIHRYIFFSITGIAVVGVKIEGSLRQNSGSYMMCALLNLSICERSRAISQAGYGVKIIQNVAIEVERLSKFVSDSQQL
ncbi:hypothetical protein B0H14DRAFT_3768600 [Mycena olivaceomarginata]|nr:hypothetical protein B0H14DRAFT_3768600 [Mycena olivaceomarginata]